MEFTDFVQWAFYGVISGSVVYGVAILQHLKISVDELNERMATIVEKSSWHERQLEKLEDRVLRLETK